MSYERLLGGSWVKTAGWRQQSVKAEAPELVLPGELRKASLGGGPNPGGEAGTEARPDRSAGEWALGLARKPEPSLLLSVVCLGP